MSIEQNKHLVQQYFQVFTAGSNINACSYCHHAVYYHQDNVPGG